MRLTSIRYIFDAKIEGYIDAERANLDMAITSLSYLCSRSLDPELCNSDLEINLISGRYRLLGYFASHWPAITLPYARKTRWGRIDPRFSDLLTQVAIYVRNYVFKSDNNSPENAFENESLQRKSPEGYEILCAVFQFRLDERSADWNLSNSKQASAEHAHSFLRRYANLKNCRRDLGQLRSIDHFPNSGASPRALRRFAVRSTKTWGWL
jgi:hypothetical protein